MSLVDLVDNANTDKNTGHSYLDLYQQLLEEKKHKAKNVLEIGINQGGSIKLWSDFFTNAIVHALDTQSIYTISHDVRNRKNIILYTETDAYNEDIFKQNFLDKNIIFDFVLDDGSHKLEDMKKFIKLYTQVLADDGILIIEDVQDWDWIEILINEVPEHLKQYIKVYDLRYIKERYDDIVFTIDKTQN